MMRDLIIEKLGTTCGRETTNGELLEKYRHSICAEIVKRLESLGRSEKRCGLNIGPLHEAIAIVEAVEKGE